MKLVKTTGVDSNFQQLVSELDRELKIRDGEDHAFYAQFNASLHLQHVMLLYVDEKPVACGAFKKLDDNEAELKRMFTLADYRGKGYASTLLLALENWAASLDYKRMLLETGINQPEAVALYKKAGYIVVNNYGPYIGITNSICMEKQLIST